MPDTAVKVPLPPLDEVFDLIRSLGFDVSQWSAETTIEHAATESDLAFFALVAVLEQELPEPFPEDLLEAVVTLGELYDFAVVKASRNQGPADDDE